MWNIILSKLDGNVIRKNVDNQPKESGIYVCTCVRKIEGEIYKYLRSMEYHKNRNCWTDIGSVNSISHNILAWTDEIPICDFEDFDYIVGELVEKEV